MPMTSPAPASSANCIRSSPPATAWPTLPRHTRAGPARPDKQSFCPDMPTKSAICPAYLDKNSGGYEAAKDASGRQQTPDCCGNGCYVRLLVPPDGEQVEQDAVTVVGHVPGPGGRISHA